MYICYIVARQVAVAAARGDAESQKPPCLQLAIQMTTVPKPLSSIFSGRLSRLSRLYHDFTTFSEFPQALGMPLAKKHSLVNEASWKCEVQKDHEDRAWDGGKINRYKAAKNQESLQKIPSVA